MLLTAGPEEDDADLVEEPLCTSLVVEQMVLNLFGQFDICKMYIMYI